MKVRVLVASASVAMVAACTSGGSAGKAATPSPPAGTTAAATTSAAPVLDPGTASRVLAALPLPASSVDVFAPAVFTGSSSLGDLGSASWNIHQRGNARIWAAKLYIYRSAPEAQRALQRSPAAGAICAGKTTPLSGFSSPGAAKSSAVACTGKGSAALAWVIVEQANGKVHTIYATNAASQAQAVAAARPVLRALIPVIAKAELAVRDLKA
jgi:hypothetical protein